MTTLTQSSFHPFRRRLIQATIPCCVLHTLAIYLFRRYHPTGALAVTLALFTASMMIALVSFVAVLAVRQRDDEFQRKLLVRSMLWGLAITLAITTTWGYIELFADGPPFPARYTFVLYFAVAGLTNLFLRTRNRPADE
jgi:hypothetical protein